MPTFVAKIADTDRYTGPDTSTPWARTQRGSFRYLHGWLLVVTRTKIAGPRRGFAVRYEATVDSLPAPARTEGLHVRMSDAKAACEDYVQRSCDQCRRHGFLRDLSGKEYTCGACNGAGVVRG